MIGEVFHNLLAPYAVHLQFTQGPRQVLMHSLILIKRGVLTRERRYIWILFSLTLYLLPFTHHPMLLSWPRKGSMEMVSLRM